MCLRGTPKAVYKDMCIGPRVVIIPQMGTKDGLDQVLIISISCHLLFVMIWNTFINTNLTRNPIGTEPPQPIHTI